MKITTILVALMAFGVAGCSTNNKYNAGAPSPGNQIGAGQGNSELMVETNTPSYPQGQWYLWRYKGITPATP